MSVKIKCPHCKAEHTERPLGVKRRGTPGGYVSFTCPSCDKDATVTLTDEEIGALQAYKKRRKRDAGDHEPEAPAGA